MCSLNLILICQLIELCFYATLNQHISKSEGKIRFSSVKRDKNFRNKKTLGRLYKQYLLTCRASIVLRVFSRMLFFVIYCNVSSKLLWVAPLDASYRIDKTSCRLAGENTMFGDFLESTWKFICVVLVNLFQRQ